MYPRILKAELLTSSKNYPVVTLLGPRQSGKTTLACATFPKKKYISLEDLDLRELAASDPRGFLSTIDPAQGAILDEIQRVPELLSYIQSRVDKNKKMGEFILTGSAQFQLHEGISQSLAGRTAITKLLPLSIPELGLSSKTISEEELIFKGFFPAVYDRNLDPTRAYRNYFETYVEKDVRLIKNIENLAAFQKFVRLLAGRIGSVYNMDSIASEIGVSQPTIRSWTCVLETSFILFFLQPFHSNFSKRLVKRPKLYFYDVGLATYLLGIEKISQLKRDPLYGSLFENLVVTEALKERYNKGLDSNLYFFRDSHGNEVDLILKRGNELVPIEIKSGATFHKDFLKGIEYFKKLKSLRILPGAVIYAGQEEQKIGNTQLLNYKKTAQFCGR